MDSGFSILNLSTNRKVLSLLSSITGLHLGEAWGLETGDCKNPRDLTFSTLSITFFDKRGWMQEARAAGCKRPELDLFDGPCILSESGELLLILVL